MFTAAEIKTLLALPASASDEFLELAESAAVSFMEAQTGRHFGTPESFTERVQAIGGCTFWLRENPAETPAVTLEEYDGDEWATISAADYEVDRPRKPWGVGIIRLISGVWPRGYVLRVTYTAGYEAGQEPADVRAGVLGLVGLAYRRSEKPGIKSETIGGYSYTLADFTAGDIAAVPGLALTVAHWRARALKV